MNTPLISIIIPNWNGKRFLKDCFDSLRGQTFKDFEIILVDNHSKDDSLSFTMQYYPEVKIVSLNENKGFAGGVNEGIKASNAEMVFLLNNDTIVDLNCLQALKEAAVKNPDIGFFATKMIFHGTNPPVINAAGDALGIDGSARNIGYNEVDAGQYDIEKEVFGACAGAALYRRKIFDKIGLFDEDFYIILEDVDIDFRAQMAGFRCLYVPKAVVYHIHAGSMGKASDFTFYWISRNDLNVLIKNMPLILLSKHIHNILLKQLGYTYMRILQKKIRPMLAGEISGFLLLYKMLLKRYDIQFKKKASTEYIEQVLLHEAGFSAKELNRFKAAQSGVSYLNRIFSTALFLFSGLIAIPIFILSFSGSAFIDLFIFIRRRIFPV